MNIVINENNLPKTCLFSSFVLELFKYTYMAKTQNWLPTESAESVLIHPRKD